MTAIATLGPEAEAYIEKKSLEAQGFDVLSLDVDLPPGEVSSKRASGVMSEEDFTNEGVVDSEAGARALIRELAKGDVSAPKGLRVEVLSTDLGLRSDAPVVLEDSEGSLFCAFPSFMASDWTDHVRENAVREIPGCDGELAHEILEAVIERAGI